MLDALTVEERSEMTINFVIDGDKRNAFSSFSSQ